MRPRIVAPTILLGSALVFASVLCGQVMMSCGEFRNAVIGKDAQGVIKAVGRPSSTSDFGLFQAWNYEGGRFVDPISGKIQHITVNFTNGIVSSVQCMSF